MENITDIFRRITPEELEIRDQIKQMQREAAQMRRELQEKQMHWMLAMERQQDGEIAEGEIRITEQWIRAKSDTTNMAIKLKEQKILALHDDIQKAASIMSRQMSLL